MEGCKYLIGGPKEEGDCMTGTCDFCTFKIFPLTTLLGRDSKEEGDHRMRDTRDFCTFKMFPLTTLLGRYANILRSTTLPPNGVYFLNGVNLDFTTRILWFTLLKMFNS